MTAVVYLAILSRPNHPVVLAPSDSALTLLRVARIATQETARYIERRARLMAKWLGSAATCAFLLGSNI